MNKEILSHNIETVGEIREHIPEGNTIIFEGPQRWGKTLAMVIFGYDEYCKGRTVFSNIQLGYAHEPLEFEEIELEDGSKKFWDSQILIDELNFYFDCRRSLSKGNVQFGTFLLQQKKQGANLTGTTHDLYSLDLRMRDNHDYLVNPEVFPKYPKAPKILKLTIRNGPQQARMKRTFALDCRPYLGMYDTFATYNPFRALGERKEAKRKGRRVNLLD